MSHPNLKCHSVVSVFTTTGAVLAFCAPPGFLRRLLDAFTLPLSGLLTARFLLHLRRLTAGDLALRSTTLSVSTDGSASLMTDPQSTMRRTMSNMLDDFGEDPVSRAGTIEATEMKPRNNIQVYSVDICITATRTPRLSSTEVNDLEMPCGNCARCQEEREVRRAELDLDL
ncbi:hypothetical protein QCA50_011297 [Cerrena zonata]|uniref:Uncharacterized protein n=1 Tax=Cerrena zonata TaxID=2478898 RepID=A0AAW0G535_9APHY